MKAIFIFFSVTFLTVNTSYFPKADLMIIYGIALGVDYVTHIIERVKKKLDPDWLSIVWHFIQYTVAILLGMLVSYLGVNMSDYNKSWTGIATAMNWINNGLLTIIIGVEIRYTLKNVYNISPNSTFSVIVIKPLINILSIKLEKNPINMASRQLDQEEELEDDDGEEEITPKTKTTENKNNHE